MISLLYEPYVITSDAFCKIIKSPMKKVGIHFLLCSGRTTYGASGYYTHGITCGIKELQLDLSSRYLIFTIIDCC